MSETKTVAPALKDVLGKGLKATGQDVPDGNYAGVLFAFGEPFMLAVGEKFKKANGPAERAVMEFHFGVRTKEGLATVNYLVPVPDAGATNKKSNMYKALKALKGTDAKFFDKDGNFKEGVTLESFLGATASVQVKHNTKDFAQVETLSGAMDGVVYPSLDDCKALVEALKSDNDTAPF